MSRWPAPTETSALTQAVPADWRVIPAVWLELNAATKPAKYIR
jgi:hypothetical protein